MFICFFVGRVAGYVTAEKKETGIFRRNKRNAVYKKIFFRNSNSV